MARHFLLPFLLKAKTAEGRPTDFMQHLIEAGLNDKEYMTDSMILSNVTGYGVAASILDPRYPALPAFNRHHLGELQEGGR